MVQTKSSAAASLAPELAFDPVTVLLQDAISLEPPELVYDFIDRLLVTTQLPLTTGAPRNHQFRKPLTAAGHVRPRGAAEMASADQPGTRLDPPALGSAPPRPPWPMPHPGRLFPFGAGRQSTR